MRRNQNSHYKRRTDPVTEFCLYPKGTGRPLKGPQFGVEQVKGTWLYLHFEEISQAAERRADWNGTSLWEKMSNLIQWIPDICKNERRSLRNAQSNRSNTHKKAGRGAVGRERAGKANGIAPQHPRGYSRGPQDANKHFEPQLRPPWNLQMV